MQRFNHGLVKAIKQFKHTNQYEKVKSPYIHCPNTATPLHSMIDLMDVSRKVIRTVQSTDEQTEMNISNYNNGLYLLRVRSKKSVWVEKFIKR